MKRLHINKLRELRPCDFEKREARFGKRKTMNIEQAFASGFTVGEICWLLGKLQRKDDIMSFANFCAKQADAYARGAAATDITDVAYADVAYAADYARWAAAYARRAAAYARRAAAADAAADAADAAAAAAAADAAAADAARAKAVSAQKDFLNELLK